MKTNPTHRSSPRSLHCRTGFTVLFLLAALTGLAAPFGTEFTYQGRMNGDGRRLISASAGREAVTLWDVGTWQAWRAPSWEEIAAAEAKKKTEIKQDGRQSWRALGP